MDKMQNFVVGDIVTPPSPATSGTSVTVDSGSYFPDPSTFGEYNLVMWDKEQGQPNLSNCEIVRVTDKTTSGDNAILTITRAQESTTAKELAAGWRAYLSTTQKYFDDLKTYIDNLQLTKANLADTTLIEDTTNTNSYEGTFAEPLTTYETGLIVNLKATNGNTGASTLNIDSLGVKSIKKNVSEDLTSGDIKAGQIIPLVYDGTNWQIVGGGGGGVDLEKVYPVGSIYINATNSTNPATLLGFGTWVAWGSGRVPVGVDTGQTEFDTVEETGGAKTHTLDITQIPSHSHDLVFALNGKYLTLNTGGSQYSLNWGTSGADSNENKAKATGGGLAHNNLQPYITCYMWKRTA